MNKSPTRGRAARYLAGGVYALLAVYQMLATHYIIQFADPAKLYLAWQLAVGSIGLFAAMAVWMFAGGRALGGGARRGVMVGTLLYVLYQLLTHEAQAMLIQTAVYQLLPGLYEQTLIHYVLLLVRLLLVVLAAFFAQCSRAGVEEAPGEEEEPVSPAPVFRTTAEETMVLFTVEEEEDAPAWEDAEDADETEAPAEEDGTDDEAEADEDNDDGDDEADEESDPYNEDD